MNAPEFTYTSYRVAAIQYEPSLGEKEKNITDLLHLVEEAAQHNARLIVLPEMATTGYCWESRSEIAPYVEPIPGPTTSRFQQLALQYDCYITVSLAEVDPTTDVYYNSLALIGPRGLIGTYRKIHSYISDPRWARDGDLDMPVWETPLGRLAGLICQDASFFEAARIPALRKADVLLFPTNWLEEKCPSSWWMARAFENGVYFIAADRYGIERGVQFSGGSCVIDPDGSIQDYLDSGDGIVYGEVDLNRSRNKSWGSNYGETIGDRLADRLPTEYITLVHNSYLWEPLRYHGLYGMRELPPGQLSCVGIMQVDLQAFLGGHDTEPEGVSSDRASPITLLRDTLKTLLNDHAPARPDILVLPELMLPGPLGTHVSTSDIVARIQGGAIEIPGPEIDELIVLANEYQISIVLGVAEKVTQEEGSQGLTKSDKSNPPNTYYNTILLIDPEGVYGKYRKIHLTHFDKLWANHGNLALPAFDSPTGRIGLATGYDVLFPETLRVLAAKGVDLVCAPTFLNFPDPIGLGPSSIKFERPVAPDEYDPTHSLIWRVRAAEHQVYLAVANWVGKSGEIRANGYSGIYSPSFPYYPWVEVIADDEDLTLTMMTIDTREQRTGRRSTTTPLQYAPGEMAGSLTGELAYDILDSIPGNVVRSKPLLRKRMPFWYLDIVRRL
ncbi:MAG TPA: nitrilase-related carbon-nitrogen hydrolase [Ktedonobacteraceae bacterium]|nr:nitrilase-related carbon-nitrogen hydrolase [Ktedonobacteraceae bacterium]